MINAIATVPEKFVTIAVDKLISYFSSIRSEALPILEFWEKIFVIAEIFPNGR